jgi:HPt (histidine-containing phosphotransfer) domain-containing protein
MKIDTTSAAHGTNAEKRLLNFEITLSRFADDEMLLADVSQVFIRTVPQLLKGISEALDSADAKRAAAQAHSLKGAVAAFEAPQVLGAVTEVERHAKNQDTTSASAAFALAHDLVTQLFRELTPIAQRSASS